MRTSPSALWRSDHGVSRLPSLPHASMSSRQTAMDADAHHRILDSLLHPSPQHTDELLNELGLAGPPSQEEVHREIEEKLLLPQDKFPEHWLPTYQVYV